MRRVYGVRALVLSVAMAGCRVHGPGLAPPGAGAGILDAAPPAVEDAGLAPDRRPDSPRAGDGAGERYEPPGIAGPPALVGCSDGTREGFVSLEDWRDIAGCSGAWDVPGAMGPPAVEPHCGRAAGDTGSLGDGQGCSAADLCAEGWHVCRDAAEVARRSPTGCESAVAAGETRLFVVAAGASLQGVCLPDPAAANDLHGCGGVLGQPETAGCQPLERRMGFADCAATGVWACGAAADHLREAAVVTKSDATLGGVLCCRD
jgi:hypothetical protein